MAQRHPLPPTFNTNDAQSLSMRHSSNVYQQSTWGQQAYYGTGMNGPSSNSSSTYSSHYAQALQSAHYAQAYSYDSHAHGSGGQPSYFNAGSMPNWTHPSNVAKPVRPSGVPPHNSSTWYTPGNCKCTYEGCAFVGSAKSLEIHRMDRHLIYPPGWHERKKRADDWDADPSLKGKKLPVQGTNIVLDTPEQIDAWIAERKRRWPSAARVEDKVHKRAEAVKRGQLDLTDPSFGGRNKRRRLDGLNSKALNEPGRGGVRGQGRRQHRSDHGHNSAQSTASTASSSLFPQTSALDLSLPPKPVFAKPTDDKPDDSSDSESDDDAPPEAAPSKPYISTQKHPSDTRDDVYDVPKHLISYTSSVVDLAMDRSDDDKMLQQDVKDLASEASASTTQLIQLVKRPRPQQPKQPPTNPFAPKQSLLRNLLLPEIRMTISNLSQAIRFLVDNDFLEGVELNPGDAQQKIEVIDETSTANSTSTEAR